MTRRAFLALAPFLPAVQLAEGRPVPRDIQLPETNPWRAHNVSWYCPCDLCCGYWDADGNLLRPAAGVTALGHPPVEGSTVAVDPRVWPYGTLLEIQGVGVRLASDCGGAIKGHALDVYVDDHDRAIRLGRRRLMVRRFVAPTRKARKA